MLLASSARADRASSFSSEYEFSTSTLQHKYTYQNQFSILNLFTSNKNEHSEDVLCNYFAILDYNSKLITTISKINKIISTQRLNQKSSDVSTFVFNE